MRTIDTRSFVPANTFKIPFRFLFLLLVFLSLSLGSCTTPYGAYIRNTSRLPATVDVFLLNKKYMKTLPNQVNYAERIVTFKAGFHKYFYKQEVVHWIDTSHFQLTVQPNTTIDLTDMTGRWVNASPTQFVRVIVNSAGWSDTLVNERGDLAWRKFKEDRTGFINPLFYYDVTDKKPGN